MKIRSASFADGAKIPVEFAFALGARDCKDGFGGNRNPHLAWDDAPAGTRSFVLLCIDTDAPTDGALVADTANPIPVAHPRGDFVHWAVADIPADVREIAAGSCSDGFTAKGKPAGRDADGVRGLNDYTGWFAGDKEMAGQYFGYDGPFPPFNDSLVHHYVFTLYALNVERAPIDGVFTGPQVRQAIYPHVLAEATYSGTYTLNRRLIG